MGVYSESILHFNDCHAGAGSRKTLYTTLCPCGAIRGENMKFDFLWVLAAIGAATVFVLFLSVVDSFVAGL